MSAKVPQDVTNQNLTKKTCQEPVITDTSFFSPENGLVASRTFFRTTSNNARIAQLEKMRSALKTVEELSEIGQVSRQLNAKRPLVTDDNKLPADLRNSMESLSGLSLDHVTVHYNSSRPKQIQAHAFAQGSDIYLGPGQEEHLPHEVWHVVQQAQGRVKPTLQMKTGSSMNNDQSLETEADIMGRRAMSVSGIFTNHQERAITKPIDQSKRPIENAPIQARLIIAIGEANEKTKWEKKYNITDYSNPNDFPTYPAEKAPPSSSSSSSSAPAPAISAHFVDFAVKHAMDKIDESFLRPQEFDRRVTGEEHDAMVKAYNAIKETAIKDQLRKWIVDDNGGTERGKNPIFGRKTQFRIYTNYYDLARALLGWIQAKPARHEEKLTAEEVLNSKGVSDQMNGLLGKLNAKFKELAKGELKNRDNQPITSDVGQKMLNELRTDFILEHKKGIGTYLNHFRAGKRKDGTPIGTGLGRNLLQAAEVPTNFGLIDKVIAWHDITDYLYGLHPHLEHTKVLPMADEAQQRSTSSVDILGKRIPNKSTDSKGQKTGAGNEKVSRGMQRFDDDELLKSALKARGINEVRPTRDESDDLTKFARSLGIPIWSGQSFTAMKMFKMAKWAGASHIEMTALAWSIFAFWRLAYDHRFDFAYHTLHEVMDIATNFGVDYRMSKGLPPQDQFHAAFERTRTTPTASPAENVGLGPVTESKRATGTVDYSSIFPSLTEPHIPIIEMTLDLNRKVEKINGAKNEWPGIIKVLPKKDDKLAEHPVVILPNGLKKNLSEAAQNFIEKWDSVHKDDVSQVAEFVKNNYIEYQILFSAMYERSSGAEFNEPTEFKRPGDFKRLVDAIENVHAPTQNDIQVQNDEHLQFPNTMRNNEQLPLTHFAAHHCVHAQAQNDGQIDDLVLFPVDGVQAPAVIHAQDDSLIDDLALFPVDGVQAPDITHAQEDGEIDDLVLFPVDGVQAPAVTHAQDDGQIDDLFLFPVDGIQAPDVIHAQDDGQIDDLVLLPVDGVQAPDVIHAQDDGQIDDSVLFPI